jgi:hypothetical protein
MQINGTDQGISFEAAKYISQGIEPSHMIPVVTKERIANDRFMSCSSLPLLLPRTVGIDAALDLGDALLVAKNHRGDGDGAAHKDRNDRHEQSA